MVASRSLLREEPAAYKATERVTPDLSESNISQRFASDVSSPSHLGTSTEESGLEFALVALQVIIEQKGLDVSALDLNGISDVSDYFIIASGTSERHTKGIADKIIIELKKYAEKPLRISGYENGRWVILDYGDFMVHIFHEEVREFYRVDELWGNAKKIPLAPELEEQAKRLRTGMFL